jgi:hypothetical protein
MNRSPPELPDRDLYSCVLHTNPRRCRPCHCAFTVDSRSAAHLSSRRRMNGGWSNYFCFVLYVRVSILCHFQVHNDAEGASKSPCLRSCVSSFWSGRPCHKSLSHLKLCPFASVISLSFVIYPFNPAPLSNLSVRYSFSSPASNILPTLRFLALCVQWITESLDLFHRSLDCLRLLHHPRHRTSQSPGPSSFAL